MSDWYVHTMGLRRQALERAAALRAAGVERVDFVYAWYNDEDQVLAAKAFDGDGEPLPDDTGLANWEWLLPRSVPGWPGEAMLSYSPRHHQVLKVGEVEWPTHFDGHPLDGLLMTPVAPVLDPAYEELVAILTWHPGLPDDVLRAWVRDPRPGIRAAIASNPSVPMALLEPLAQDAEGEVRAGLARNPSLTVALAHVLADDPAARFDLANNRNTPPEVLSQLAPAYVPEPETTEDYSRLRERRRALENHSFPIARLEELWRLTGEGADPAVAEALARHPEVSQGSFASLCRHPKGDVRFAALRNMAVRLPLSMVLDLVERERHNAGDLLVAFDFGTPDDRRELDALLGHPEALLSRNLHGWLARNLTIPPEWLSRIPRDKWSRYCLARNPNAPPDLLDALAADPAFAAEYPSEGEALRAAASARASRASRDAEIEAWAGSADWVERLRAARCPDASEAVLRRLLLSDGLHDEPADQDQRHLRYWVREALAAHRNLPVSALARPEHEPMRETAARRMTSPSDLRELAADSSWQVRRAVARNSNTPGDVLDRLADDEHEWVREGVRHNIAAPRHRLRRGPAVP